VFYNRILCVWVFDPLDYILISALIGSLIASRLKEYLSEKAAMERLKSSIINEAYLLTSSEAQVPIWSSKRAKIKQIYRFALGERGGQFIEFQADFEFSNEAFNLAQNIKGLVERLAVFLKKRELKGIAKIFFKNGRLMLQLLLYNRNIDITYVILNEALSPRIIVITASVGGAAGFILSWFSVGAILVSPPVLISTLLLRSTIQQILNQREYSKFKKIINKMLDDDELKETIQAFFMGAEGSTSSSGILKMEPLDFDKKSALKDNLKSDEGFEEFIKARMNEELGLIENPTEAQLQEIIQKKVQRKPKGKTVLFGDFIDENPYEGAYFSHSDIIDAEILEEPIRIKSDKEL
jgi:hypothetical protein